MSCRKLVCVSTSNPSLSVTPGGGGGSITILCPHTGSILSSVRVTGDNSSKTVMGVSSLSLFPEHYVTLGPPLMLGYGGTTTKRDDTYGMLLSLRSASSPPLVHWKCRLPEAQLSCGIMISPCGNYIVGGGASGTCFVWSALGGALLVSVKAHYRSIISMAWSDCASFLVTGGADGIVHVFSLLDLVERERRQTVSPIRTWSVHHLPVTALLTMPSGRMISSSEDGQLVMMELFSQKVLFTIQMPHAIRALAHCSGRLFTGGMQGIIYLIDLDQYAVQQTAQLGVVVKHDLGMKTLEDQLFSTDRSEAYKAELLGHEKPITSLAILKEDRCEWLISGDEAGEVRIWDLESRGCVRVIQPWAYSATATTVNTSKTATSPTKQLLHPVTSILIVQQNDEAEKNESSFGNFGARTKEGKMRTDIVNLIPPLQRYTDRQDDGADERSEWIPVPFLQPKRAQVAPMHRDNMFTYTALQSQSSKRSRFQEPSNDGAPFEAKDSNNDHIKPGEEADEVSRLQKELEEARSII